MVHDERHIDGTGCAAGRARSVMAVCGGRLCWLDLIRFMAAFAVLAFHFRGAFFVDAGSPDAGAGGIGTRIFYTATRLGHEAVVMFFVLSGFLVGGRGLTRIVSGQFRACEFAVDRAVRIMLPLISALLLYLPVCLLTGMPVSVRAWAGALLSLQGVVTAAPIEVLWTLAYEVWFYILLCAVGYGVGHRGTRRAVVALMAMAAVGLVFCRFNAYYLFIWLTGMAAWFVPPFKSRVLKWLSVAVMLVTVYAMQSAKGAAYFVMPFAVTGNIFAVTEFLFAVSFSLFVSQVVQSPPRHRVSRCINRAGTRLAAFSYTLYLTHIPVMRLLEYLGAPRFSAVTPYSLMLYAGWLAVAMVTAWCVYMVFERNTPRVRRMVAGLMLRR